MARETDEKTKLLLGIGVMVIVVLTLLYLIYRDYTEINETKTRIERHLRDIETAKAKIKEIPALREQRYKLTHAVEEYVRILPDRKEVEALYDTLSEFEKKSGVQIRDFAAPQQQRTTRRQQRSANFIKETRDVRVIGDFFQVATFINLIENYKRFMRVDSISMRPSSQGSGMLDVRLKLSTFIYRRRAK